MKRVMLVLCTISIFGVSPSSMSRLDDWYMFQAGEGIAGSLVDMSDWLAAPAGRHGSVQAVGDAFVFEDGTPVKFWGTNVNNTRVAPERAYGERWADYWAAHGINAVRFHKFTWHRGGLGAAEYSTQLDPERLDRMDYFHHALKQQGIYVGWSHIYGHRVRPGDRDRLEAYDEVAAIEVPWSHLNGSTTGLVNFAPDLQALHIELTVNMLNHRNPHTGLRYADDPALIFVELQNEDNIFWSAVERVLAQTPTYRAMLERQFSDWLRQRYGSHAALVAAWGTDALEDGEHLDLNNIYPKPNHDWFQMAFEQAAEAGRLPEQHYLDRARFLYETQVAYYNRFVDAIRATGYEGPIVGSCWQAGVGITHFYNLHADYEAGFIDRHNYYGGGTGHRLAPGTVRAAPMVTQPGGGLLSTGMQQVEDRPFVLSEWMSLMPNEWTAEAAPIVAAYGLGLQGWDGSYAYASNQVGVSADVQAAGHGVYNMDSPLHVTLYPALARMIYRGDVQEGAIISRRSVHLPSLEQGMLGFEEMVQQQGDVKVFSGTVPQETLAAGRVVVAFTDQFEPTPSPLAVLEADGTVQSNTGQLTWHTGEQSFFTIDTPGTQGVVGFGSEHTHRLQDMTLTVETPFAVVLVTSLDQNKPIRSADQLLVTTVARARNRGMQYSDDGARLLEVGEAPVLMEPVETTLRLGRSETPTVHVLSHDGHKTGQTIPVQNGVLTIDGAEHKTLYYVISYK